MKSKGLQKHNFWTLYGIGKKSETQTMLIFKNSKFPSFFKNWENWEVQLEEHSKIPKVFVHWEKPQSTVEDLRSKNHYCQSMDESRKVLS